MASTTCGRCGCVTFMSEIGPSVDVYPGYDINAEKLVEQAHTCANCNRISVLSRYSMRTNQGDTPTEETWTPRFGVRRDFPDVPEHIASAASEAVDCHNAGAFRASGALARAVVEATAKEKKLVGGDLWQKIEKMKDLGLIREFVREAAHEVRHFGNNMAHGDFVDSVSEADSAEALDLMSEVLVEVYQSPARVARVRTGRLARKAVVGQSEPPAPPGAGDTT